ncbi:nucleolar complex protein 2 isoform X2 [Brevipalpus obovatus]|uniref:nucleolar complex protein 2 isoform X2 n=1 Tax=Brevipalpus obovatus TaxID=246614 RepID=UPI003D9EB9C4
MSELISQYKSLKKKFDNQKHDKATISTTIRLFKSLVIQFDGQEEGGDCPVDPQLLDAVVRLCLVDLLPAIHQFLRLPPPTAKTDESAGQKLFNPSKSNKWPKLAGSLKVYLGSMLKLMDASADPSIVTKLLRHILYLIPFYLQYLNLTKHLLKRAMVIWSQGSETNRILAFLIILRLMRQQESEMIGFIMKKLYLSYVKNCKIVSKQTLPMINFMQQSLVELYSLDQGVAYQHAFVFTRQCAITLRNAYSSKEEDVSKPICNSQYLQSLLLWSRLLTCLQPSEVLKPLIHPLVQVMTGTIKHLPIARFYPLRFHIIKALIKLSIASKTFIPILPLIIEVLDEIHYNEKLKVGGNKLDLDCLTRVSQQVTHDRSFIDACVNRCHDLILEYLASYSYSIAFPELVCFPIIKIKKFNKSCKKKSHGRMMKKLLDKIEENAKMIEMKRKSVSFSLQDSQSINQWENEVRDKGTPLVQYFEEHSKIRAKEMEEQLKQEETEHDEMVDDDQEDEYDDEDDGDDDGDDDQDDQDESMSDQSSVVDRDGSEEFMFGSSESDDESEDGSPQPGPSKKKRRL